MDVETEILDLKRRMGDLEGAVNVLTGHLREVHPELRALGEVTGRRFDSVDALFGRVFARLDTMNTQIWSLRDDMPDLLSQALGDRGRSE
jgi:hypothetical protein